MKVILSSDIKYTRPPINEFLIDYNNLMGRLFRDNFSLKFLASSTITKLEAHTHFYELVQKYIQLKIFLTENKDVKVKLIGEDNFLSSSLKKDFNKRVIGKNNILRQKVLFLARLLKSIISTFLILLISGVFAKPKRGKYDYIFRTYFYSKNVENNIIHEEYFDPVVKDISQVSATLCVFKFVGGNKYIRNYLLGKKQLPCDSTFLEYFLSPYTIIKATLNFLRSKIVITERVLFKGYDITDILNLSLKNDFLWLRGYTTYLEYEAAKKIGKLSAKRILWPYENQNWEKVYGYLKSQGLIVSELVGMQHSGLSYKLIHYFPSIFEKHLPVYPDYILTVGEIFKRLLTEKGNFPSKIVAAAATRQDKLFKNLPKIIKSHNQPVKKAIAYAYSYDLNKYSQITKELIKYFKDSEITVYLKFHPRFVSNSFVLNSMGIELPPNFIVINKANVEGLFSLTDCILYDDNSVGFEGMLYGVKTYMFDCAEPIYDCNRLFYTKDTKITSKDLPRLKEQIENNTFINDSFSKQSVEYLKNYYTPYNRKKHLQIFLGK